MVRSKRALICLLIACLTLTAVSCSGPGETPEQVLAAYTAAINDRDYEAMYGMISQSSGVSKDDFIARNKNIYEGIGASNVTVTVKEKQGDTLNCQTSMDTRAGKLSFENTARLVQDGGTYKLVWDSHMIFPNLGDTDKVRVDTQKGERGSIFDRNGKLLAGLGYVYSVGFVPGKINESTRQADIEKAAGLLGMTVENIESKLSASWVRDDLFVPLKYISYSDSDTKDALLDIDGIRIGTEKDRVYPLGEAAAHLTGYIQSINAEELKEHAGQGYTATSKIGKIGLESLLEERIRAIDGCRIYIVDKDGKEKETLIERKMKNGENVTLTIDSTLQNKLYNKMKGDKGAAVVMDPKPGEVLALVSTPSYDPNDFILGVTEEKWAAYNDEATRPMYNRFKASFAPGSAFKPVTAAAGLTAGAFKATDDFGHSGTSWQKNSSWGDYRVTTLKEYSAAANVRNALVYSDNIYFAKAALKIGAGGLADNLKKAGFGEELPFEFGLTRSSFGSDLAFGSEIDLADSGFGQGRVLVNPLHLASIYTAFSNGGDMLAPYLEKGKSRTVWKKDVFSDEAVSTVKNALINVVEDPNGTGHSARISGVKLAGKTGTAEIKDSKEDTGGTELGWFVAFNADDSAKKKYLALAVVEDVKDRGGSHYVIPIVRSVFE